MSIVIIIGVRIIRVNPLLLVVIYIPMPTMNKNILEQKCLGTAQTLWKRQSWSSPEIQE